jgi:hypothetical protein
MTPTEFKAWFEGFTEAMAADPTPAQWAKVKERVAQIDGKPVTERIYLDHYWPRPWRDPWVTRRCVGVSVSDTRCVQGKTHDQSLLGPGPFNSSGALRALGSAEYEQLI